MTSVFVSVLRIPTGDATDPEVIENFEFEGETWTDALDAAYDWLKANRDEANTYHVWC